MHKHTCTESHTAAWTNTLIYSLHTHTRTRTHWEEEITLNLVSGGVNAAGSNRVMKLFERWDEVQPFPLLSVSALMCWWLTGVRDEGGGGRRGGGKVVRMWWYKLDHGARPQGSLCCEWHFATVEVFDAARIHRHTVSTETSWQQTAAVWPRHPSKP